MGALASPVERRLELLLQESSPKCPQGSFSFLGKSSCSILPLHTRKGLSSHTAHLSRYSRTVCVRAPHTPTLNSPQLVPTVSVGLPLCPYSPPCDFKQPGLSWCCSSLVWQGREPLTRLSPRSPAAGPVGSGLGLQSLWSCTGPRDLYVLKQSPYPLFFFSVLYTFWFPIFINGGVHWLLPLFLSRLGRCFTHVQGEVDSTPTYLLH